MDKCTTKQKQEPLELDECTNKQKQEHLHNKQEHLQIIICTVCRTLCKWGIRGSMVSHTTSGPCTLWRSPTYGRRGHNDD